MIGTSAAILGAAVLGAGATTLASSKAAHAATAAADQNAAVQREAYQQTRQDLQPYSQAGQTGLNALMHELGLPGSSTAEAPRASVNFATPEGGASAPAAGQAGGQDWMAYLQANPDALANFQELQASGRTDPLATDPIAFAQHHWADDGGRREVPTFQAQPQTPQAPPAAQPSTDLISATRPAAPAAPTFQRPTDLAVPTYERAPAQAAPKAADYFTDFKADPGFQFRLSEGLKAVNAASAARGKLRSGDAAMALQERGDGLAAQGYNDWFNRQNQLYTAARNDYQYGQNRQDQNFAADRSYGTNLWDAQQTRRDQNATTDYGLNTDAYRFGVNRADDIFNTDRGYQTQRADQRVSNLFGLTGIGQNAAAGTASAGNVFAQQQTANNNQRAETTANAAIAGAGSINNLLGAGAQAYGTYAGLRGRVF